MTVPSAYQLILLAVAAFRVFHLLAEETILDRPRRWVLRLGRWEAGSPPASYRHRLGSWLTCPWCCGFWVTGVGFVAFQLWEHTVTVLAAFVAATVVVPALQTWFDREG